MTQESDTMPQTMAETDAASSDAEMLRWYREIEANTEGATYVVSERLLSNWLRFVLRCGFSPDEVRHMNFMPFFRNAFAAIRDGVNRSAMEKTTPSWTDQELFERVLPEVKTSLEDAGLGEWIYFL